MRGETVRPVLPGLDPCVAAKRVLGNAIRCTKRLQSDERGAETAEGRLLPETSRLFESASFREVGTDPGANQLEAGAETGQSGREVENEPGQDVAVFGSTRPLHGRVVPRRGRSTAAGATTAKSFHGRVFHGGIAPRRGLVPRQGRSAAGRTRAVGCGAKRTEGVEMVGAEIETHGRGQN
jgi:hypothetical protein